MTGRVLVVALAISLAGCLGDGDSGLRSRASVSCLEPAGPSPPAEGGPAVVALLGDFRNPDELRGRVNRLVRFSLPGGAVEARRGLGPRWKPGDIDRLDSSGRRSDSGPQLAATPDGRTVLALVRYTVSGRASVAVVDARNLRVRCSHPLAPGVRYSALLLGRSRTVYALGARHSGRGRSDAVLTMVDAETGEQLGTRTLREADQTLRVRTGKDWFAYGAALSADERRLILSYHGGDTTGADLFRISPGSRVSASGRAERRCRGGGPRWPCGPGRADIPLMHGAVAAAGAGFVAATGGQAMLRLDGRARVAGRIPVATDDHLMDFEIDAGGKLLHVSACGATPSIVRVDLARGRRTSVPSGDFCGSPLAVHAKRLLVLNAARVDRWGYQGTRSEGLRLLDLRSPGAGRPIPRSAGALDAVVVGTRR